MRIRQRGVSSINVADHIRIRGQDYILINQADPGIDGPPV